MSTMAVPRCCLQLLQQIHDLRLHRDVERGGGLVGEQEHGVQRERHRDHGALAHTAGELVWILLGAPARVRDADLGQQFDGPLLGG